jgi:hypothetical protein
MRWTRNVQRAGWKRAAPLPEAVVAQPGATGKAELENRILVLNKSSRNTGRALIRAPAPPPWTEWRRTPSPAATEQPSVHSCARITPFGPGKGGNTGEHVDDHNGGYFRADVDGHEH